MRPLLWLGELRIRLIAGWQTRRMFCGGYLTPEARWQLRAAKRRTP